MLIEPGFLSSSLVRLRFQHLAHLEAIGLLVALRPRRPDGGSARSIEEAELDSDRVSDFAHDAAKSIHFAHQVSLGNAANGRDYMTSARSDRRSRVIESGLQPHAGGRHRGLASGMACAHHDYVEMFVVGHLIKNIGERSRFLHPGFATPAKRLNLEMF